MSKSKMHWTNKMKKTNMKISNKNPNKWRIPTRIAGICQISQSHINEWNDTQLKQCQIQPMMKKKMKLKRQSWVKWSNKK